MLAQCGQISFPGKKRKKTLSYLHPHLSFRWRVRTSNLHLPFPVVVYQVLVDSFPLVHRYWRPPLVCPPRHKEATPLTLFFLFFLTKLPRWLPLFLTVSLLVLLLTISSALLARSWSIWLFVESFVNICVVCILKRGKKLTLFCVWVWNLPPCTCIALVTANGST